MHVHEIVGGALMEHHAHILIRCTDYIRGGIMMALFYMKDNNNNRSMWSMWSILKTWIYGIWIDGVLTSLHHCTCAPHLVMTKMSEPSIYNII